MRLSDHSEPPREFDIVVIGGGLVGASIAWGLARTGEKVGVLDEGDLAPRPSRGNFALIWVQGKGLGLPEYSIWSRRAADLWSKFAAMLRDATGIDVHLEQPGGLMVAMSEAELERLAALHARVQSQPGMQPYEYEVIDHTALAHLLPQIGPDVAGATYSPLDGHVNSLRLFRALHEAMRTAGVSFRPLHHVNCITHAGGEFRLLTDAGEIRAGKIVLAAGHDNARLAPMLGLHAPVRPQRGQIIVTEKVAPFLRYPLVTLRQTDEGSIMIGDSLEDVGFDDNIGAGVLSTMADRAIRIFPFLANVNVVRTWAALRVMSKDGFPIYDQSVSAPGAFLATCHSGVTLAANHALLLPEQIRAGRLKPELQAFSGRRFDVPQAA